MLKIMEAFSYAREYWDVGLCVKASNLDVVSLVYSRCLVCSCFISTSRFPSAQVVRGRTM